MSIYKITSSHTPDIYIGKTKQSLSARLTNHKSSYKRYLLGKEKYCCRSKSILKYSDAKISLVELATDNKNLKFRERYHIENTPNCVNKIIPGQSQKEWYSNNPVYRKKVSDRNRDRYYNEGGKEKKQAYYLNNPEYREAQRKNHRDWYHNKGGKEKLMIYNNVPEYYCS